MSTFTGLPSEARQRHEIAIERAIAFERNKRFNAWTKEYRDRSRRDQQRRSSTAVQLIVERISAIFPRR